MFDIDALTAALTILAFAASILLLRALAAGEPIDLGAIFGRPWEPAWPRGVQEEEPRPWRLDRLDTLRAKAPVQARPVAIDEPCREARTPDLAA